jgi:hypothetical protein
MYLHPYLKYIDMSQVSANRNQRVSGTQADIASSNPHQGRHQRQPSEMVPQGAATYAPAQKHSLRQVGHIMQQRPDRQIVEGSSQVANRQGPTVPHISQVQSAPPDSLLPRTRGPSAPSSSELKVSNPPPRPLIDDTTHPLTPLAIDAQTLPITPISPNHSGRVPSQRCTPTPSIRASQTPDVIDLTVDDDVPAPVPVVVDGPAADANSGVETIHSPASSIEVPLISRRSSGNMAELQRPASRDQPVAMDSPASSIEEPLMKRSISDMEGVQQQAISANESRKKMRLDDSAPENGAVIQVESHPSQVDESAGFSDEEKTVEEIGLMSAEDCVAAIFTEDEEKEGEQICSLCV